jgi:hypothetical protein
MSKLDLSLWPRVTQILSATGVSDFSKIRNAEFYLQRGQDIHMITASIDANEPDYWTGTDLEGYAKAWINFRSETGFVPSLVEYPVYHEARQYKGTLDRTGKLPKYKKVILDIKSGIVADWTALQLAAYESCLPDAGEYYRIGVSLSANGKFKISEFADYRRDSQMFFALVASVHARREYGQILDFND